MIERLKTRIAKSERQGGFTLIELLVVVIIIGILLAIAVPSYLNFKKNASEKAAAANVRAAIPAVENLFAEEGNYTNLTVAKLKTYDAGVNVKTAKPVSAGASYCIDATDKGAAAGSVTFRKQGPGGPIEAGSCP